MGLDNLRREIRVEQFGSLLGQPKEHVDSHAEIRCQHDRYRMRCLFNSFALLLRVAGRSNDERFAMLQRGAADFIDAVGLTEVDCYVTIFYRWLDRIPPVASRRHV